MSSRDNFVIPRRYSELEEGQQKLVDTYIAVTALQRDAGTHMRLPNTRNTLARYIADFEANRITIEADARPRGVDPENPTASFPPFLKAQHEQELKNLARAKAR